ncbi:DUF397 domain-containing protein [Lipingzhangella rawalii]|uniref:DUF397 domain-containing protein n=1 Tax=Lipingzhangella rawalii TaxID=2055835 RepID=UPI003898E65B
MPPEFEAWKKSSYSQPEGPNCLEFKIRDKEVSIRDSQSLETKELKFPAKDWVMFLASIRS